MSLLTIEDATIRMAGQVLLDHADLRVDAGRRIGLVGRNGAGKSTLLRAIAGELPLNGGTIHLAARARMAQVRQEAPSGPASLLDTVLEGDAVVLEVPETPSSGYLWQLPAAPAGLALMRDEYQALDGDALGGRGWHRFLFRVEASGHFDMVLEMRRPWQRGTAAQTAHVAVTARPQPTSGIVQPGLLVAAVAA